MYIINRPTASPDDFFLPFQENENEGISFPPDQPDFPELKLPFDIFSPCNILTASENHNDQDEFSLHSLLGNPFSGYQPAESVLSTNTFGSNDPHHDFILPNDDCKPSSTSSLLSQITEFCEPATPYCAKRRHTTCGDLCRSLLKTSRRSIQTGSPMNGDLCFHALPIRYDVVFGDVFPCDTDEECFFVRSKRRADIMKAGIV